MTRKIDARILTPFGASSNMGNWRTAQRYAQMLRASGIHASIFEPAQMEDALGFSSQRRLAVVLNAARCAKEVGRFLSEDIPTIVVLTGTDLYGTLKPGSENYESYKEAEKALLSADAVITLQSAAQKEVQRRWPQISDRVHCILQTSPPKPQHAPKITINSKTVRFLIAGHIRPEKDPITAFMAFAKAFPDGWATRADGGRVPVRLIHVGGNKDKALATELIRLGSQVSGVLLEGPLTHAETLRLMTHVHGLVQPSIAEGGALVVSEAVARRLPIIASDIDAHKGQLGSDYPGFFAVGSSDSLAQALTRFIGDEAYFQKLHVATQALTPKLAAPAQERAELVKLVRDVAGVHAEEH